MQTTTNYGYNLVESTDACNVPVQISPNFTGIDTDLKAVSDAAITTAVDTFASNTHALVRDDADRNYLYFVAPADYTAGDTFTLDGVTINVTNVAGEALETNAFRVNSVVAGIVYGSRLTLLVVNPVNIPTLDADNVTYDNTLSGLTASDVQAAIDEIASTLNTVNVNVSTYVSGTILAGNTSITLANATIRTTSFIDVYFKDVVMSPSNVLVTTGSVTIEIPAQNTDTDVAVRIANL